MDFSLTEDEQALKDLVGRILDDATAAEPWRTVGEAFDTRLWATLGEAGVLGVPLSEEAGGLGMGMEGLGIVLEEVGRTLTSVPLATALPAAMAVDQQGSAAQKEAWLPQLASGAARLAVALEEVAALGLAAPATMARAAGNRWQLQGVKEAVAYGEGADGFLVSAATEEGAALFLLEAGRAGMELLPQQSSSGAPWAQLTLKDVDVGPEDLLGKADGAALQSLLAAVQVAAVWRQVGIGAECLQQTARYVSTRVQFGRPIGALQAVRQRMADGFIDVEAMRSLAMLATAGVDAGKPIVADIAAAKYWAAMAGHRIAHTGQHLHGGMGADVTYPIHRYFLAAVEAGGQFGGAHPMLALVGHEIAARRTEPFI